MNLMASDMPVVFMDETSVQVSRISGYKKSARAAFVIASALSFLTLPHCYWCSDSEVTS